MDTFPASVTKTCHTIRCWDGKNLDSPNHKDHVAYPSAGPSNFLSTGNCPASHPVKIPQLMLEVRFCPPSYPTNPSSFFSPRIPTHPSSLSQRKDNATDRARLSGTLPPSMISPCGPQTAASRLYSALWTRRASASTGTTCLGVCPFAPSPILNMAPPNSCSSPNMITQLAIADQNLNNRERRRSPTRHGRQERVLRSRLRQPKVAEYRPGKQVPDLQKGARGC